MQQKPETTTEDQTPQQELNESVLISTLESIQQLLINQANLLHLEINKLQDKIQDLTIEINQFATQETAIVQVLNKLLKNKSMTGRDLPDEMKV